MGSIECLNKTLIEEAELNYDKIIKHQQRIKSALAKEIKTTIPIVDGCSIANGQIISFTNAELFSQKIDIINYNKWCKEHLITAIPAAGAASRFLGELQKFCSSLEDIIPELIKLNIDNLTSIKFDVTNILELNIVISAKAYALYDLICEQKFDTVKKLSNQILNCFNIQHIIIKNYACAKALIWLYADIAKSLVPTTKEGDTFLFLKLVEQNYLMPCSGNILIVPSGQQKNTEKILKDEYEKLVTIAKYSNDNNFLWSVVEQGQNLSTIRFDAMGNPYINKNGQYSLVAAGHGELIHLFTDFCNKYPQAECLHIRNIDNVIGVNQEKNKAINTPAILFKEMKTIIDIIRTHLNISSENNIINSINFIYTNYKNEILLLQTLCRNNFKGNDINIENTPLQQLNTLINLFTNLFTWQKIISLDIQELANYLLNNLSLPLSIFGVVKKETGDVGGGPVIVKTDTNKITKICLEMPHANEQDTKTFFAEQGLCTHFNPVLVFFELTTNNSDNKKAKVIDFNKLFDDNFWLLSQKEYQTQTVYYHETVMYELIGNSKTSNLLFVEIPRILFKPHKTIFESLSGSRQSYGFQGF